VKTIVKNAFSGLMLAALFLLVLSVPARAQVVGGTGEVAGYGGMVHVEGTNQAFFGGSGGYNLAPAATVFGEYNFVKITGANMQMYGGGARFNFLADQKVVPYVVGAFGGAHEAGTSGWYAGFGGGASIYLSPHVGVRPEYRFVRVEGGGSGANASVFTGGVFYQFGGTGTAKKKK
jgi:hypothetical protein